MNLLWVVTKPPWPPVDGGRLLVLNTLAALCARGHAVDLVAPCAAGAAERRTIEERLTPLCSPHLVPVRHRPAARAALVAAATGLPLSIARHRHDAVGAVVEELLRGRAYDAVHAEQLQALAQCAPARARGVPIVLRCQNVESDLWSGAATRAPLRLLARREAARLAAFEGRALGGVAAAVALTDADAARLGALAGDPGRVVRVAAPFPAELPPGPPLAAPPPVLAVLASTGWRPNDDGIAWLVAEAWPRIRAASPAASLHLFGASGAGSGAAGVVAHPAPRDSRDAFPEGALCLVPLRYGSGVRMRILEAWARGVPVVATAEAVHGLDARHGHELLVARDADAFAAAVRALDRSPALRAALSGAGRARLRATHDPDAVAARLEEVYARAAGRAGASAPPPASAR